MKPNKQPKVASKAPRETGDDQSRNNAGTESEQKDDKTLGHDDGAVKPTPVPLPVGSDLDPFPRRATDPIPRRDPHRR